MQRIALLMMCGLMSILAAGLLVSDAGAATCTVTNGDDGYADPLGIIPKSGTLRHCLSSFSITWLSLIFLFHLNYLGQFFLDNLKL